VFNLFYSFTITITVKFMSEKIWRMRSVLAIRNNTRYHGDAKNAN